MTRPSLTGLWRSRTVHGVWAFVAAWAVLLPMALGAPPRSPWTASLPAPAPPPAAPRGPKAMLASALADPNTAAVTLLSLATAESNELAPLFAACAKSSQARVRQVAVAALYQIKGAIAAGALWDRVRNDTAMPTRAQALALLIQMKAATPEQLQEAMRTEDETLQCLAANGLVLAGQGALAQEKLLKLAASKDPSTSGLARLCLVSLGHADEVAAVAKILSDPATPEAALDVMLSQIQDARIAAAAPAAEALANATANDDLRVVAWRAVSAAAPDGARKVAEAIAKSDKTPLRVKLFRVLARHPDAPPHMKTFSRGSDVIAAMARLELSRPAADAEAAKAAAEALASGHPVVLGHVLDCIKEDVPKLGAKSAVYVPVLLDVLRKTPKQMGRLRVEQEMSAWASTLLADIGTPEAMEGLKALLNEPYGEVSRAAVGGLLRTKNPAAAAMAKPLLESPYEEIATTAAVALARHGDKSADKVFREILARADRQRPDILAIACWYTLKLAGESAGAVEELAKAVK
jgi:hypothetical protein